MSASSLFCQKPGCLEPIYQGYPTCGRTHGGEYDQMKNQNICLVPSCGKPKYESHGAKSPACSMRHFNYLQQFWSRAKCQTSSCQKSQYFDFRSGIMQSHCGKCSDAGQKDLPISTPKAQKSSPGWITTIYQFFSKILSAIYDCFSMKSSKAAPQTASSSQRDSRVDALEKRAASGSITFYDSSDPDTAFMGNFYPIKIKEFNTSEAYYQSFKFLRNPLLQAQLKQCPDGDSVWRLARDNKHRFNDALWKTYNAQVGIKPMDLAMEIAVREKFQNPNLQKLLLATGEANLIENSKRDFYWGIGDGTGRNELGKLHMRLREELTNTGSIATRALSSGEFNLFNQLSL